MNTKNKNDVGGIIKNINSWDFNKWILGVFSLFEDNPKSGFAYALSKEVLWIDYSLPEKDKRKNRKLQNRYKKIKCINCSETIKKEDLTPSKQNLIFESRYDNVEIKCPYCRSKMILKDKKISSDLGYSIWDIVKYKDGNSVKELKVLWIFSHSWNWSYIDRSEAWDIKKIEILLKDEEWKNFYITENKTWDWVYNENFLTIREEIYPDFNIEKVTENWISIDWTFMLFYELENVITNEINGINLKNYLISEWINLWKFRHNKKTYVCESRLNIRRKKINFYSIKKIVVSKRDNFNISPLNKYNSSYLFYPLKSDRSLRHSNFTHNIFVFIIFVIIVSYILVNFI